MLTGQRAFDGETVSDTLAAVLRADIDWDALPPRTPPAIRRLLRRCLERDPKRGCATSATRRIALDEAARACSGAAPADGRGSGASRRRVDRGASVLAGWRSATALCAGHRRDASPSIGQGLGGPVERRAPEGPGDPGRRSAEPRVVRRTERRSLTLQRRSPERRALRALPRLFRSKRDSRYRRRDGARSFSRRSVAGVLRRRKSPEDGRDAGGRPAGLRHDGFGTGRRRVGRRRKHPRSVAEREPDSGRRLRAGSARRSSSRM